MEEQTEEREALLSIYEGDESFKEIDSTTYQYKYGEEDNYKSFLVEIKWTEQYPAELPIINMDTFYNRNLISIVKEKIKAALTEEAKEWLGCAMTYTLFECIKDRIDDLTIDQTDCNATKITDIESELNTIKISDTDNVNKKQEIKKEQLTKAQKRRQWEQTDHKGERPRGWNWVDIVKHLSQTGSKNEESSESNKK